MKTILNAAIFLDVSGVMTKLKGYALTIGEGVIAIVVVVCIVKAAVAFMGGDSEKGWKFVWGCIIGVVLFGSISFFTSELPNLIKQ